MASIVRITLVGLPERVHEIADVIDKAIPDTFEWHDAAGAERFEILLRGVGMWGRGPGSPSQFDTNLQ